MDDKRFDTLTQALAADGSRRRVLGALAGGIAATLAGAAALEAKRGGNGKSRGRGNGANGGNGNGRGRGREKVFICHRTDEDEFTLIRVGAPAARAHGRHGDVVCEEVACQTPTGCGIDEESGEAVCVYETAEPNTKCVTDDDEEGFCDNGGNCVVADPTGEGEG